MTQVFKPLATPVGVFPHKPTDAFFGFSAMPRFAAHAGGHFHRAMQAGYATSPPKTSILELPGMKVIPPYKEGGFRVLDMYSATPGVKSAGVTVMWYDDTPIWMMQYGGEYGEEALPCLKEALKCHYMQEHFHGVRGPRMFSYTAPDGKQYTYLNTAEQEGFKDARGVEEILGPDGRRLGHHKYQCFWLVTPP